LKAINHEKRYWYKQVRIDLHHKHFKSFTYNALLEWDTGDTTHNSFNVDVLDESVASTKFSKGPSTECHDGMEVVLRFQKTNGS
jgi:hypothetical protein